MVFIGLYLVLSIIAGDFYKVPMTVIFMVASIYAIAVSNTFPFKKRIDIFSRGASSDSLMLMLWIYVLAGAFAASAKGMGAIDATVNLSLSILPTNMLLPGLFVATCFISISIGTSVGTVVATQTQGCKMSDKFRVNSLIVAPAAILILVIYAIMGQGMQPPAHIPEVDYLKVVPYVVVLITAVCGMNVMAVLTIGIALCGIIGLWTGSYELFGWMGEMGKGIVGMGELIIIAMMAGGMLEIIRENGGIDYIIRRLTAHVHGKRGAELSIGALVSLVNICTANNTVAILTVGNIAKQIGDKYGVDNRKCASILDTFSCTVQGLIPYGVQMLLAAGLAHINPMQILPYLYYPMAIGVATVLAILFRYPRKYS